MHKNIIIVLALIAAINADAQQITPHNLVGGDISGSLVNGGSNPVPNPAQSPFEWPLDGKPHTRLWTNNSASTWHIQNIAVTPYLSNYQALGWAILLGTRISDKSTVFYAGTAFPAALGQAGPSNNYSPNSVDVAPGDSLEVGVIASGSSELYVHFFVLYFTD
jgi:hypothetical protein